MRPYPWSISSDRHDRELKLPSSAQRPEAVRHRSIAPEQNASPLSTNDISVVASVGVTPHPGTPMPHLEGFNFEVAVWCADYAPFAPREFSSLFIKARAAQEVRGGSSRNDLRLLAKGL